MSFDIEVGKRYRVTFDATAGDTGTFTKVNGSNFPIGTRDNITVEFVADPLKVGDYLKHKGGIVIHVTNAHSAVLVKTGDTLGFSEIDAFSKVGDEFSIDLRVLNNRLDRGSTDWKKIDL